MRHATFLRRCGGIALWFLGYHAVWGAAWFAFMRREWLAATAAVHRTEPWNEIWLVFIVLDLVIGAVIVSYVAADPRESWIRRALSASALVWLVMTAGMAGWGWMESFGARVIVLDSAVNLAAMLAAGMAGSWALLETKGLPAEAGAG